MIFYAAVPVATMIAGGTVAAFWPPGKKLKSGIQHFAAGVVVAVVAAEMLPDVKQQHSPVEMALSFALGVAAMLGLRVLANKLESRQAGDGMPWGLLGATGIDVFIDGLVLGVGVAFGGTVGLLLTIALAVELLSLGVATAAEAAGQAGRNRWPAIGAIVGLAVLFAAGTLCGSAVQGLSHEWLSMILSFGCAALLYLVTEELLVEAHQEAENPLIASLFFAGFLVIFLLDMIQQVD